MQVNLRLVCSIAFGALACAPKPAPASQDAPRGASIACAPHASLATVPSDLHARQAAELRAAATLKRIVQVGWHCTGELRANVASEALHVTLEPRAGEEQDICVVAACTPEDGDGCVEGLALPVQLSLHGEQSGLARTVAGTLRSAQPGEVALSSVEVDRAKLLFLSSFGLPETAEHVQEDAWLQVTATTIALSLDYEHGTRDDSQVIQGGRCTVATDLKPVPRGAPERSW